MIIDTEGRACAALKKAAPNLPILIYSDQEKPSKADMLIRPGLSIRRLVNCIELYSPYNVMEISAWTKRNSVYSRPMGLLT